MDPAKTSIAERAIDLATGWRAVAAKSFRSISRMRESKIVHANITNNSRERERASGVPRTSETMKARVIADAANNARPVMSLNQLTMQNIVRMEYAMSPTYRLTGVIQWLLSDAAAFVTGVVIPIDGGFSAFSGV